MRVLCLNAWFLISFQLLDKSMIKLAPYNLIQLSKKIVKNA